MMMLKLTYFAPKNYSSYILSLLLRIVSGSTLSHFVLSVSALPNPTGKPLGTVMREKKKRKVRFCAGEIVSAHGIPVLKFSTRDQTCKYSFLAPAPIRYLSQFSVILCVGLALERRVREAICPSHCHASQDFR